MTQNIGITKEIAKQLLPGLNQACGSLDESVGFALKIAVPILLMNLERRLQTQ
jgi:hypothetical protein